MSEATLTRWSAASSGASSAGAAEDDPRHEPAIRSIVQRHQVLVSDVAALPDTIQRLIESRTHRGGAPGETPILRSQNIADVRERTDLSARQRNRWQQLALATVAIGLVAVIAWFV